MSPKAQLLWRALTTSATLVEKAGYKVEDTRRTWDRYSDVFKEVQTKLRAEGVRNVYRLRVKRDHERQRSDVGKEQ